MSGVGTTAWVSETGGRLRVRDFAALGGQAANLQTRLAGRSIARLARAGTPPTEVEVGELAAPQTEATAAALEVCTKASEEYLLQHCHRSYLWGMALARREDLDVDAELLYVASMLHDLGITATYAQPREDRVCFTVPATAVAHEIGAAAGWGAERSAQVAEAITLHLNPRVPLQRGTTAYLLAAGTAFDVVGVRADQVSEAARDRVIAAHPRLGLKENVLRDFRRYADGPRTRTRFLLRAGQFAYRVRHAPYAE